MDTASSRETRIVGARRAMAGGRPPKGDRQRHPELEKLADWFARAIEEAGYGSLHAVVQTELATPTMPPSST
jgi:hypothetical protein